MRKFDTKMHLWSILNLIEVLYDTWVCYSHSLKKVFKSERNREKLFKKKQKGYNTLNNAPMAQK